MKKYFYVLTIFFCTFNFHGYSQNNNPKQVKLESTDVFLVNLTVDTIFQNWHFKVIGKKYHICKITINKIYHMSDTVYMTYSLLSQAKFMLYNDTSIKANQSFNVSMAALDKDLVFIMGKFLNDEDILANNYYQTAVILSLGIKCRKINKFLRMHLTDYP